MNLQEFKAWFEGFSENMNGVPTKKQWEKIQAKIATIEDKPPMSYPVFIDRYRHWFDSWPYRPIYATSGYAQTSNNLTVSQPSSPNNTYLATIGAGSGDIKQFNSYDAFKEMGKAEAMQ